MMTLLILAMVVLGLLAVTRLSRVYELTSALRGKREWEISERDGRMNARLMWLFAFAYFGFFLWLTVRYQDRMLPVAASEHGVWLDDLMNFNWVILIIAFFITNTLLFYFAGKYYFRKDRRGYYYPHNNKWELAWTLVPAVVMIGIIIYGLNVWNHITRPVPAGTPEVELYAQQFNWTARYPGKDGVMGATDFRLINETNPLGIVTPTSISTRLDELDKEVKAIEQKLADEGGFMPPAKVGEMEDRVKHLRRMRGRIVNLRTLMEQEIAEKRAKGEKSAYEHGSDDIVIKEFHLPVRENVKLVIRSKDVIHSVYIPHLRAQMNAVPGVSTLIHMKPTITTDSMRTVMKDQAFDFVLLCNKICGASHYNMQMPLVVEPAVAYQGWLAAQKGWETADAAAPAPATVPGDSLASPAATAQVADMNQPKTN